MNTVIALILATGVAGFAFTKLGRRAGYGNQQSIYGVTAISFVFTFIIVFTVLHFILHLA